MTLKSIPIQIIHIYIISHFKCERTIINNILEYGCSYFSPNFFLLYRGAVNHVFHDITCVKGSFQSAVERSTFWGCSQQPFRRTWSIIPYWDRSNPQGLILCENKRRTSFPNDGFILTSISLIFTFIFWDWFSVYLCPGITL